MKQSTKIGEKMLIGLDASRATRLYKRGVEHYSFHLIKALARIDSKNQYLLYSPTPPQDELTHLPPNFSWKIMPFPRFWTQLRLSWEMLKNPPDILFVPSHVIPFIHPKKTVLTIHDLGYKHFPKAYPFFARLYENFALKFLAKSASKIITPSLATKNDLIQFTNLSPDKISVIYHGFDQKLYTSTESQKPTFPYLLFVGKLEEKKNVLGLIRAFRILRGDKKIKHKLVLIGQPGYQHQKIKQAILNLPENLRCDILELGYLPGQETASWLEKASVFVFPSFFEGFGIPVIEAMAAGVPVVASNTPALSEISGGASLMAKPDNPEEIARAVKKVIIDQGLCKKLIEKGLKRAKDFSWQKCAKETLNILNEVG